MAGYQMATAEIDRLWKENERLRAALGNLFGALPTDCCATAEMRQACDEAKAALGWEVQEVEKAKATLARARGTEMETE
jgi:hypothetical protein